MAEAGEDRLRRGYREIRRIADDGQAPWPGMLVSAPDGRSGVLVDAGALGPRWRGWSASDAGHVLVPLDVLRRRDGHDALLPVCTERLADFLARRGAASDLSTGEGVTAAVSLLRGLVELDRGEDRVTGCWWLTDAGRPVFATGASPEDLHAQTRELLTILAEGVPALRDPLQAVIAAMTEPSRRARAAAQGEQELFEVGEPVALATTTFGPRRAVDATALSHEARPEGPARPGLLHGLARHVDADWADVLSRASTEIWRRLRAPRTSSRRPLLLAGGVAVAVLVAGLVWPTGSDDPAAAGPDSGASPRPSSTPVSPASPTGDADAPSDADQPATGSATGDLAVVAGKILAARVACDGDADCLSGLLESADAQFPPGAADLSEEARTVTLLDEFGGAAVLRVDARDAQTAPQLVVVVRADDRWLLRDVYDVAQQ